MDIKNIYNELAGTYDKRYQEPIHIIEENIVLDKFYRLDPARKVLSVGVGTGQDITALQLDNEGFLGVDISYKMLQVARRNYPDYQFQEINAVDVKEEFDTVVALFGVVNYLTLAKFIDVLSAVNASQCCIVTYNIGYKPAYLKEYDIERYTKPEIELMFRENSWLSDVEGLSYPYDSQHFDMEHLMMDQCYSLAHEPISKAKYLLTTAVKTKWIS